MMRERTHTVSNQIFINKLQACAPIVLNVIKAFEMRTNLKKKIIRIKLGASVNKQYSGLYFLKDSLR